MPELTLGVDLSDPAAVRIVLSTLGADAVDIGAARAAARPPA